MDMIVIIVILVIVLIALYAMHCKDKKVVKEAEPEPKKEKFNASGCSKKKSPEENLMKEQMEYFSSCGDADKVKSEGMTGGEEFDVESYIMDKSLDPAVKANHDRFIKGQEEVYGKIVTGRPKVLDFDRAGGSLLNSWILRRPQNVKVDNPTQIADVDFNDYANCNQLAFSASC